MRLKLDENIGSRGERELRQAGHDVSTVSAQNLRAATDLTLIQVCQRERRSLVTLDLDFANPIRFHPRDYSGIAVLRLPDKPSQQHLLDAIQTLIQRLAHVAIDRKLWIIEVGRVREYQDPEDDSSESITTSESSP